MTNEFNPYLPPDSALTESVAEQRRELVSNWRRLGTWLIDYVCLVLVMALFGRKGVRDNFGLAKEAAKLSLTPFFGHHFSFAAAGLIRHRQIKTGSGSLTVSIRTG